MPTITAKTMPPPAVLMIVTLDTKAQEAAFVRETLEAAGVRVVHLDASVRATAPSTAEITPEELAATQGMSMDDVRALKHEGKCLSVMMAGAVQCALAWNKRDPLAGIIAIGGSMGSSLGTTVMKAFPYGVPKVMVSTMASGFTVPFVGSADIAMFNSVCDIAGLNSISRGVYLNAATAAAAMALRYTPVVAETKPLVAITTLSTTDRCSVRIRRALTEHGCEVMVFHTLGTGGPAMDQIISERDVAAVVDLSLVEINDTLHGGLASAGLQRARAALNKGVPTFFAPGNIDFIVAGPLAGAEVQFPGRRYHVHNPALTAVRSNEQDFRDMAAHMAEMIRAARGPVQFFVPLQGFSAHDSTEGHLHDPAMPAVFADALRAALPPNVPLHVLDQHINDPAFADAIIAEVLPYVTAHAAKRATP